MRSLAIVQRASKQCWGVTAGNERHNFSHVRGVTAGKMGHNSSDYNYDCEGSGGTKAYSRRVSPRDRLLHIG